MGLKNVTNGATNGQGDSRSRIHGDSFAWSRWNSMCSPKTLSGIVFLPHQSQLKYVETVSLQCVDVELNVLSQNLVRNHVIYHTHHSYNMLKQFLSAMCCCKFYVIFQNGFRNHVFTTQIPIKMCWKGFSPQCGVVVFSNDSLNRLPW